MIIDVHCHLFERFEYLRGLTLDEMVETMDDAGIGRAVLFTVVGLLRDYQKHNDEIAAQASRYPDRFIPFATVNPRDGDVALREMERCVKDLGMRGFKLHPWWTSFPANSPASLEVARQGAALRVPFIIHSGTPPNSSPLQIAEMAHVAPSTTFILAHMGLPDLWKEALRAAERYPNILLETAGTPSLPIRVAVERLGPERVIYGSDMPFGDRCNVFFQIQKIRDLHLQDEAEDLILRGNAERATRGGNVAGRVTGKKDQVWGGRGPEEGRAVTVRRGESERSTHADTSTS